MHSELRASNIILSPFPLTYYGATVSECADVHIGKSPPSRVKGAAPVTLSLRALETNQSTFGPVSSL